MHKYNEVGVNFVKKLSQAGYVLGDIVLKNLNTSLREYLKNLLPTKSSDNNKHFQYVLIALREFLVKHHHPDVDGACKQLTMHPVIQQADHSNLLLDEETFLNNYLFAIASKENNVNKIINSQCSTVSCLSRRNPVAGPVFLRTRGELYNIFSFSKRTLKDSNFCAIPGAVNFNLELLDGTGEFLQNDQILRDYIGKTFGSTTTCFYECNQAIWNEIALNVDVQRIAVDESMTSHIAALHMLDESSPIYALFFNPEIRDCFINIKRSFVTSEKNLSINRSAPDFLWYKKGNRLYSVILQGTGKDAYFYVEDLGIKLPVDYDPESISIELKNGNLYVDKIISYLARCILPGILAVGGTSQQDYVKDYINIILETHKHAPYLDQYDYEQVKFNGHSVLGGAPLLELNKFQKEIIQNFNIGTNLSGFSEDFLDLPIGATIGAFNCASYLCV